MKLSELKINPDNPQTFDDLSKLENSIRDFPKMMNIRQLVYDPKTMQMLGGNKRLVCLQNMGFKEIPDSWTRSADELTPEEKKRFIIADNVGFGEWDWEKLEEWDKDDLESWGLEIPDLDMIERDMIEDDEEVDTDNTFVTKIMTLRNNIARGLEQNENIPKLEAFIKAEMLIINIVKDNEYCIN